MIEKNTEKNEMKFSITEKSMFVLSWLTARGSGTSSVCFITETLSPTDNVTDRQADTL